MNRFRNTCLLVCCSCGMFTVYFKEKIDDGNVNGFKILSLGLLLADAQHYTTGIKMQH